MLDKLKDFMQVIMPNIKGFKETILTIFTIVAVSVSVPIIEKYIDQKFQHVEVKLDNKIETQVKTVVDSTEVFYSDRVDRSILKHPEIDVKIETILTSAVTKLGAGKAQICIFHNGTKTIGGDPFLKFSCTNEVIVKGKINIERTADQYQNSSYARIAYYALEMNNNGHFIIDDLEDLKNVSIPDYQAAEKAFVKSIAFFSILKHNGIPMGFVVFYSYDKQVKFSEHIDYLKMVVELLSYEIMLKYDKG